MLRNMQRAANRKTGKVHFGDKLGFKNPNATTKLHSHARAMASLRSVLEKRP
jgi:hypothetical protein